ncbi:MAG: uroporphyrinogen-III decarboxylase-like protein [Planctomycetes bacterium SM23_32]|nr:MAG: uroporphyrinogen-III decarboxylase-like protein [Planctomycetes bacterium SM23_32]
MPTETMTPKERWLAVLNHERPDRIPTDYWATPEATARLADHLGCADLAQIYERLHIDAPVAVWARYVGPPVPEGQDVHGCRYRDVEYEGGVYRECVSHPLARYGSVDEIEANYTWPTPDWFDYSVIPAQVEGKDHLPIKGGGSEPFLTYKELRGQEQAFMDLVLNPDIVDYCLDRLFAFCYDNTRRIYEQIPGRVTLSYVAEDMGSQEGLLMSRDHIHRFLLPRMKRMMELAHEAGAYVFFHSDGAVLDIVPDMIEAGIDVLNPIQWRCRGMDREAIKSRFGDRVALHGAVDNQLTLAFGSSDDVEAEVADNIRILGEGGGYVLAPCHNIQAVSPPENVVAMYEAAYALGWY